MNHATFIDAGCRFSVPLLACCINENGEIMEAYEA